VTATRRDPAPDRPKPRGVGTPDKTVDESRERIRAALHASGFALPQRRITVFPAPALPRLPEIEASAPHFRVCNFLKNILSCRSSPSPREFDMRRFAIAPLLAALAVALTAPPAAAHFQEIVPSADVLSDGG
jgi:hypothetical protein